MFMFFGTSQSQHAARAAIIDAQTTKRAAGRVNP